MKRPESWQVAAAIAVGIGVAFSVLLMSVAFGVSNSITGLLDNSALRSSGLIDVDRINSILALLTIVITAAMLSQTAAATFTVGVTVMRSRREEVAIRRQSGVMRSSLIAEFLLAMLLPCVVGGLIGEAVGCLVAFVLDTFTVLPVRFTAVSLLGAFPITIVLAMAATLLPAWRAANASPAMLRKEG